MLKPSALLALVSALLFPLALPNELFHMGSPLLGMVALVPFYLAMCRTARARDAARLGALFGGVSTIIGNYWLMFFGDYSLWTIGGTTIGYIAYNYLLAGFLWRATRARAAYRPVLFALIWTVYEYFKSIGFLAYPWGLAAYPMNELHVFTQIVDITGVWGLTFLVVYANATIAELILDWRVRAWWITSKALRNLALVVVIAGVYGVYGGIRLATEVPVKDTVDLVLIQQNADSWDTRSFSRPLRTAQQETNRALAELETDPELIVWSETSLRYFFEQGRNWYADNPDDQPFLSFVEQLPAPLLTGSPYQDPSDEYGVYNAALMINQDTSVEQWYGKQHLVPFAEVIPFWQTDVVRHFFQDVIGIPGIWAPGPGVRLFEIRGNEGNEVLFATPICFEDAFAYVNRRFVRAGADLIVNLTNNSWSRTDSAQLQHLVAARFRAIETRRGLVRSTNSGYTSVIDPWGRVVAWAPMFETTHLNVTVNIYEPESESLYMVWGDIVPQLMLALVAVLFFVAEAKKKSRPQLGSPRFTGR